MPFDDILGQSRPIKILQRMLNSGRIPHAFLFSGVAGIGKHTTALGLASVLNCNQSEQDFCATCPSCKKIQTGTHPDILEIEPQKNVIKIDQIRTLQKNISYAPLEATWRVIILDPAESMNKETANCLLKTLEEPPAATVIILVDHGTSVLLPTVLSRCQKIVFAPLANNAVQTLLENEEIPHEQALHVSAHSHGSLRRARVLLDGSLIEDFSKLRAMMTEPCTVEERLELAGTLGKSPERTSTVLVLLLEWLRDIVLCRNGADSHDLYSSDQADNLMRAASHIEPHRLERKITQVLQLMNAQQHNINTQLGLESLLFS